MGTGVEANAELAAKWYQMSAEQGNVMAINNLAGCYYQGKGVAQNKDQAFKLWGEAAKEGYAYAQQNLGLRYSKAKSYIAASTKQQIRAITRWVYNKY